MHLLTKQSTFPLQENYSLMFPFYNENPSGPLIWVLPFHRYLSTFYPHPTLRISKISLQYKEPSPSLTLLLSFYIAIRTTWKVGQIVSFTPHTALVRIFIKRFKIRRSQRDYIYMKNNFPWPYLAPSLPPHLSY